MFTLESIAHVFFDNVNKNLVTERSINSLGDVDVVIKATTPDLNNEATREVCSELTRSSGQILLTFDTLYFFPSQIDSKAPEDVQYSCLRVPLIAIVGFGVSRIRVDKKIAFPAPQLVCGMRHSFYSAPHCFLYLLLNLANFSFTDITNSKRRLSHSYLVDRRHGRY